MRCPVSGFECPSDRCAGCWPAEQIVLVEVTDAMVERGWLATTSETVTKAEVRSILTAAFQDQQPTQEA